MTVLSTWPDEAAFHAVDPRRRTSTEIDLGATWRWRDSNDAWRVAWVRDTGELYTCRADGYDGSCSDVSVLAVVPQERELDVLLDGWRDQRTDPDGLGWLASRMDTAAVAC